jgi:hypothetical protein
VRWQGIRNGRQGDGEADFIVMRIPAIVIA